MGAMESLADFLGVRAAPEAPAEPSVRDLVDVSDPKKFCEGIVASYEFRQYIISGFSLGTLPAAVVCRVLDHLWGKPLERVEHTGKNGTPIVTEIRRVIVRAHSGPNDEEEAEAVPAVTH